MESSSTERSVWCQWGTIVGNFYLGNSQSSRECSVQKAESAHCKHNTQSASSDKHIVPLFKKWQLLKALAAHDMAEKEKQSAQHSAVQW